MHSLSQWLGVTLETGDLLRELFTGEKEERNHGKILAAPPVRQTQAKKGPTGERGLKNQAEFVWFESTS